MLDPQDLTRQRHATDAQLAVVLEELHRLEVAIKRETSASRALRDAMVERVAVCRSVVGGVRRRLGRHRRERDRGARQKAEWQAREAAGQRSYSSRERVEREAKGTV